MRVEQVLSLLCLCRSALSFSYSQWRSNLTKGVRVRIQTPAAPSCHVGVSGSPSHITLTLVVSRCRDRVFWSCGSTNGGPRIAAFT